MVLFAPESMDAVTVRLPVRRDQVVGAETLLTTGPCCAHFALRQTSPTPHFGSQGSAQTCLPVSQAAGAVHCESSLQGPAGDTEHAASMMHAANAVSCRPGRYMVDPRMRTRW